MNYLTICKSWFCQTFKYERLETESGSDWIETSIKIAKCAPTALVTGALFMVPNLLTAQMTSIHSLSDRDGFSTVASVFCGLSFVVGAACGGIQHIRYRKRERDWLGRFTRTVGTYGTPVLMVNTIFQKFALADSPDKLTGAIIPMGFLVHPLSFGATSYLEKKIDEVFPPKNMSDLSLIREEDLNHSSSSSDEEGV